MYPKHTRNRLLRQDWIIMWIAQNRELTSFQGIKTKSSLFKQDLDKGNVVKIQLVISNSNNNSIRMKMLSLVGRFLKLQLKPRCSLNISRNIVSKLPTWITSQSIQVWISVQTKGPRSSRLMWEMRISWLVKEVRRRMEESTPWFGLKPCPQVIYWNRDMVAM